MTQSEFNQLKVAYQGLATLARTDLAHFCRYEETTAVLGDRDMSYILEGRRQVWLRINDFINKPQEELNAKYTKELISGPQ
jgi:hypothetical protein